MYLRALVFSASVVAFSSGAFAQTYPSQSETPITDDAEILEPVEEAKLAERVVQLEQEHNADIAVVTLPATTYYTAGDDLDVYAAGLIEDWELGATTGDRSILLLVFRDDRELRLEVGEGISTEAAAESAGVVADEIVPRFRDDDFGGGISLGVEAIATRILAKDAGMADATTTEASTETTSTEGTSEGGGNALPWIGGIIAAIGALIFGLNRRAKAKLAATPCSNCGQTGLKKERVTIEEATETTEGRGETRLICPHCGHVDAESYTIAKKKPKKDDDEKGGGGASAEW